MDARRITAAETVPLRSTVLRPGRPVEECSFPGDDDERTFHAGTFLNGRIVSVASLYLEPREGDAPGTAWRLRGMATEPGLRRSGAGRAALDACLEHARASGATVAWCNARTEAVGFYERLGWRVIGDEFEIPTVGPHFVMELRLDA
jgi:GNAT superfamily N-acetyltransferase